MKDESLLGLESRAKNNKIGLWRLPEHERMPPWEFRKMMRNKREK